MGKELFWGNRETLFSCPGYYLDGHNGISSEAEEVIIYAHRLYSQDIFPDPDKYFLFFCFWRHIMIFIHKRNFFRHGKSFSVNFTARRKREGFQLHKYRRNHILGQMFLQIRTKHSRGKIIFSPFFRNIIGHNPPVSLLFPGCNNTFFNILMSIHYRFYPSELNTKSSDFHLKINTAEKFQASPFQPFHKIPCFIKNHITAFRFFSVRDKGIFYKMLLCQVRPVQISSGDTRSSYVEFTGNSCRKGHKMAVQNIKLYILYGISYFTVKP